MKYIGPFFRINCLEVENVESQLYHFAKESLKHIVFYSNCGISTTFKELKVKNIPNFDITTYKNVSPLLCLYKKANAKLLNESGKLYWDDEKFKRDVEISTNALATLSLLQMAQYYKKLASFDTDKTSLSNLYLTLSKHQLEFYAEYLRNNEGLFVDKKDISNTLLGTYEFEEKDYEFKLSNQAFVMNALTLYSNLASNDEDIDIYKKISDDIFSLIKNSTDKLYNSSLEELLNLIINLNLYYSYTLDTEVLSLLLEFIEYLCEIKYKNSYLNSKDRVILDSICYLNLFLFRKFSSLDKFKEEEYNLINNLKDLFNSDLGIFVKPNCSKECKYTCTEVVLYLISLITYSKNEDDDNLKETIASVFKKQLLGSGLVLSWPDAPDTNEIERYKNYSLKTEDFLDELFFRINTIATPDSNLLAPVFIKSVCYVYKKNAFKNEKTTFDSNRNMYLIFLLSYFLMPNVNSIIKTKEKALETSNTKIETPISDEKIIETFDTTDELNTTESAHD